MKNLFKNLMLVAVAAMAFTACTENNDEVNAVSKTTHYEFVANIAEETRSGFAEKEEGATAYKSEWHADDKIKVFVDGSDTIVTDITVDGKFEFDLTDAPETFFMTVCSPAESWTSKSSSTIPAEQTPLANSVDPKAHLLQCQNVLVSNGVAGVIEMTHQAAYGKMTVKGVEFAIDHVVVDLKGTYYGYDRELSYTINATNVENNTFWFATEPIDVAEFTVTAYGAGDDEVVAKTVDVAEAGKTMSFQYGRVGTFSVSGLVEYVEPAGPTFTSAKVVSDWGLFDQVISFEGEELGTLEVEFYNPDIEVLNDESWLKEGQYSLVNGEKNSLWFARFSDATHTDATVINITINVAWVDGKYRITFENVGGYNDETFFESAVFVGSITGGTIEDPDSRTRLDKPVVTAVPSEVEPAITFSWNAVDNAVGYELNFEGQTYTTTDLSKTFSGLEYFKNYEISVVAIADSNSDAYRNSEAVTSKARTIKDPNGPEIDPNAFTSCAYVADFDTEGYGRKYELSNESGAYLWLWVVQGAADENTGAMNAGIYNYHNAWADSVSYPGFTVKRMVLPGSEDELYIIDADMSVERDGANHTIAFDITLEGETEPTTYTFSGTIVKTF